MNGFKLLCVVISIGAICPAMAEISISSVRVAGPSGMTVPSPTGGRGNPAGIEDILLFLNKDKLHGRLLSIASSKYGLQWKHSQADQALKFALADVDRILLGRRSTQPARDSASVIYLTNGDIFQGKIVSLDGKKLVLDTWYGGKMNIERAMLKMINPNAGTTFLVYEGPNDFDEWTTSTSGRSRSWHFKDGALYGLQTAYIGRFIDKLPDKADFQFDAAWRSGYPNFAFYFYTDNLKSYGNSYMLQVSSSSIQLQRYSRNSGSSRVGQYFNYQRFNNQRTNNARFNLLVDKKTKTFSLLINGDFVKKWTDSGNFSGLGKGICFRPNSQGDLKISNIRISKWDGALPQTMGAETVTKEDLVRFANKDKVSGRLKTIADGNMKFETAYATIDVPLSRVSEILMSSEKAARARRNQNDVRAVFAGKGALTFQLLKSEGDQIQGQSENFGKVTLPLGAFRMLEFNIYKEREPEEDEF